MLDTSSWSELELDVLTELHCDPHNVRLEIADAKVESDIIGDLFVNERALDLVDTICKVGYLTHDVPVVLQRDGQYVVVEGNRRLAALKAIQNPMLVPDYQARINSLVQLLPDRSILAKIRVMVAPDQDSADQLIAAIHTSNLRRPWGPARQAAFFQAQIDAGRTLEELIPRYPTIDVRGFVLKAHMVNAFKAVNYKDPALTDFLGTTKWRRAFSTLDRIFESTAFQELTGFELDRKGHLKKKVSKRVFAAMATVIVEGIAAGDLNTRTLNTVESVRFKELIADLTALKEGKQPGDQAAGASTKTPGTNDGKTTDASEKTKPDATNKASSQRKQYAIDAGALVVPAEYPHAVDALLAELSTVQIRKHPNLAYLGIRAALEKSIKAYADAKGIDIKKTHNANGYVQLSHALDWLLEYVKANGPTKLRQPIERVRTGQLTSFAHTRDALNAVNHNHEFEVTADEAVGMWNAIDPIMKYLMKP